nr:DUF3887 domain-containing protein [Nocardia arthritidis]
MVTNPTSPLTRVASARDTARSADEALRAAVDRARDAGHTWQEIGEVLGTTRQAAFQRFGRHIDPATGAVMPRESTRTDLVEHAVALLGAWREGRWAEVRRDFDDTALREITEDRLADAWATVVGLVGRYEGMGAPFTRRTGAHIMAYVPMQFEGGEMTGRVFYDENAKVTGLFIRPPEAV